MILRTYKMTVDDGSAPNPEDGILTLAICKPGIRKIKRIPHHHNEWVAGFTSKILADKCGVKENALVYLMRITDVVDFATYYEKYIKRKDCIYYPDKTGQLQQLPNPFHGKKEVKRDRSGQNVIISEEFYYFGCKPLPADKFVYMVPVQQTYYGKRYDGCEACKFINFVVQQARELYGKKGLINKPCEDVGDYTCGECSKRTPGC